MNYIEEKFEEKVRNNDSFKTLSNQWNLAKENVTKILSAVTLVFPHYTLHDESHSIAILNNIVKILGKDTIDNLCTTDLWLLLNVAYYHDLGMFVSGDDMSAIFQGDEFKAHIKKIMDDDISPLHEYTNHIEIYEDKIRYKNTNLTLNSYNAIRFLLSDFIRKEHATRSKEKISKIYENSSQSTSLARLISIIGEICELHGLDFSKVQQLQKKEDGVNLDVCHPRFIAFMLRLGDLLDFDSSRISPILLSHLSDSLPIDSKNHIEKHLSIIHSIVTPQYIEATANCENCDIAYITNEWFSSIRNEIHLQQNEWHATVPHFITRSLPSLGKMEIRLKNGFDTIDNKYKPSFEIDTQNAIKILQGTNLYKDKSTAIRELLQNAVDATYLRIFLENPKEKCFDKNADLTDAVEKFKQICSNSKYNIVINTNKISQEKYHITITDNGIGLSKKELQYLAKIGSGKNNLEKFKLIKKMPEYAKPSGIFGIGFQSVFLLTDEVQLKSRKLWEKDTLDVLLSSPLKRGFVTTKTYREEDALFGTSIEFDIERNNSIVKASNHDIYSSNYDELSSTFDFTKNDISDVEISNIYDEIYLFAQTSYVNIVLNGETISKFVLNTIPEKIYKNKDSNLVISLRYKSHDSFISRINQSDIFFRNQLIPNHSFSTRFLLWQINILSGNADKIISVARDKVKEDFISDNYDFFIESAVDYLPNIYSKLSQEAKFFAAKFIEYYSNITEDNSIKNDYLNQKIHSFTIANLIKASKVLLANSNNRYTNGKEINGEYSIYSSFFDNDIHFLVHMLIKNGFNFVFSTYKNTDNSFSLIQFEFNKNGTNSVNWKSWFSLYRHYGTRSMMPCFEYECLAIDENFRFLQGKDPMKCFEKMNYPRTACPYMAKQKNGSTILEWVADEKFYNWVFEHRKNKDITLDQIKAEFNRMKENLMDVIDDLNSEKVQVGIIHS